VHDPPAACARLAERAAELFQLALALKKRFAHGVRIWSGAVRTVDEIVRARRPGATPDQTRAVISA
jgi:hypothetical protein